LEIGNSPSRLYRLGQPISGNGNVHLYQFNLADRHQQSRNEIGALNIETGRVTDAYALKGKFALLVQAPTFLVFGSSKQLDTYQLEKHLISKLIIFRGNYRQKLFSRLSYRILQSSGEKEIQSQ
jgi:hypothetical protein